MATFRVFQTQDPSTEEIGWGTFEALAALGGQIADRRSFSFAVDFPNGGRYAVGGRGFAYGDALPVAGMVQSLDYFRQGEKVFSIAGFDIPAVNSLGFLGLAAGGDMREYLWQVFVGEDQRRLAIEAEGTGQNGLSRLVRRVVPFVGMKQ